MANELTAGETLIVARAIEGASAATLRIGGPVASTHALELNASGEWAKNIETEGLQPGLYAMEIMATLSGGIKRVAWRSQFTIQRALAAGEMRSQARIALDNIRLMLAGQAKEGVRRYRINNRELERHTMEELRSLESYWLGRVRDEDRKASGKGGLGPRILAVF